MIDWNKKFKTLSDEEKNKFALLRVIECTNGIIQYKFRDLDEDALNLEDTREAMKFSMGCMKRMEIQLGDEVITFAPESVELFTEMRRLYVSGAKQNNQVDFNEFLKGSKACLLALGKERILEAKRLAFNHIDELPPHALDWGLEYIFSFVGW
jgi:hypothetical protein